MEEMQEFVTVAIPTYNRSEMLRDSLASALAQDYKNLRVLVMDNASTDNTEEVVRSFQDKRISYFRNDVNAGMIRNFNRAIRLNQSSFLVVLQDDDILLPGFVSETVRRLVNNPKAGFAYSLYRNVDENRVPGKLQDMKGTPAGPEITNGMDYLHLFVSKLGWTIHMSTVLLRTAALDEVGLYDSLHNKHTCDFNLSVRLARKFEV